MKKSKSTTKALKEKVKARILGKAEGHSCPSGSKSPADSDVAPSETLLEKALRTGKSDPENGIMVMNSEEMLAEILRRSAPASLAQNVLSRLTSKLPSSPVVIPKGTPIEK